jgi:hypothetical protein
MPVQPFTDLRRAAECCLRQPLWSLGLALLFALLAVFAPWLQLRTGLPDTPMITVILLQVAMLPLELYFIPRFLAATDARVLNEPRNPENTWKQAFEERWLRTLGARLLLAALFAVGFICFILPGLVVITLFGWAPMRVLLRGESIQDAFKGSARLMIQLWPKVLLTLAVFIACSLSLELLLDGTLIRSLQTATLWQRVTHPAIWTDNFLLGIRNVWLNAAFLALYQRMEAEPAPPPPAPGN